MGPLDGLDWLFALIGWTVVGAGSLLLLWALFWDRSRGRRRCPRCWYDMGGVPGLVCPECGRRARRERGLLRTRRRKKWAAAGLLVLLVGVAVTRVPAVRRAGWVSQVPTTVLVAGLPWWKPVAAPAPPIPAFVSGARWAPVSVAPAAMTWRESMYDETRARLVKGTMARWQTALLVWRATAGDRDRPPRGPAWKGHYQEFLETIWARGLDGFRPKDAPYIWPSTMDLVRRTHLAPLVHARRVSPASVVVTMDDVPEWGDMFVAIDRPPPPGERTAWRRVRWGRQWPWGDGSSGALSCDQGTVSIIVRRVSGWTDPWADTWRAHLTLAVVDAPIVPARDEDCRQVEASLAQLSPGLSVRTMYGLAPVLWIDPGKLRFPSHTGVGVALEVVHDGVVYARTEVWWGPSAMPSGQQAWPGGELLAMRLTEPPPERPPQGVTTSGQWVLRLTGDESLARRDPGATAWWKGTLELPLRVTEERSPWPSQP